MFGIWRKKYILFFQLLKVRWMYVWNLWGSLPLTRLRTTDLYTRGRVCVCMSVCFHLTATLMNRFWWNCRDVLLHIGVSSATLNLPPPGGEKGGVWRAGVRGKTTSGPKTYKVVLGQNRDHTPDAEFQVLRFRSPQNISSLQPLRRYDPVQANLSHL